MATNVVTVSGMFGDGKTYFADSPVVIDIDGLQWPESSPFNIVRVEVVYKRPSSGGQYELIMVGDFKADTGGQSSISFDVSSALKAIWSDYDYDAAGKEIATANAALTAGTGKFYERDMRGYVLRIYTEYLSSDDGGVYTTTQCSVVIDDVEYTDIPGGRCLMGGMTEWERSLIENNANRDVSHFEHTGLRNGDASTKPTNSPERVGSDSITSWVDVQQGFTNSIFYPATYNNGTGEDDDPSDREAGTRRPDGKVVYEGHAPIVLRDSQPYVDFLFINRRGAVETCSGMTKEAMGISVSTQQYSRTERPAFRPTRSLTAIGSDGRRSWQMSSGYVTREWAEWWAMEFLGGKRKQWWMLWQGPGLSSPRYVPVTVKPAKSDTSIYDKTKQQMPHVDFTVTLALEG